MKITKQSFPYILLQRTEFWDFTEEQRKFSELMQAEFETIRDSLPFMTRILDIGSGVGAIDVLLSEHTGHKADIYLFDKTEAGNIYYDFKDKGSFYNSLPVAKDFLIYNGVPEDKINIFEVPDFPGGEFDLVISLLSWGFHYPISTYLYDVIMSKGGVLITDIRKGTNGIKDLEKRFIVSPLYEKDKYIRVLAKVK